MNRKKLTLMALAGLTAVSAMAIPAKRGTRTFVQPDGSVISLNLIGDEHFHSFITIDGLAVSRASDGFFHYLGTDGLTGIRANNPSERTQAEKAFLDSAKDKVSVSSILKSRQNEIKARRASAALPDGPRKASQVPTSGSPKVPVLLVQYSDYKFKDSDPKETFKLFFSEGSTSAHQYFVDQSNGRYTPQFDVYGPVTLAGTRATYGGNINNIDGNDRAVGQMVAEGCLGLDSEIDFSQYDNDGDGVCDVVIVLYAGDGEASSYDDNAANAVWPCQWSLSGSDYRKSLTLDNTTVNKFAVFNELYGKDLSKIDGIGTFCHEFSHCLGLPDFYDTNYGPHFGMAHWSLMDYGSYNNEGFTPIGYSAYEKAFMGWIDIEEATGNTLYTLPVLNQKNASTDRAVKLTNPADPDEYYIIENRAKQGWDAYMPTEGLLITHVTYDADAWTQNTVNDYDMQRMTPVPADNSLKLDQEYYYGEYYYIVNENDLLGDLWPMDGATELTDTSLPAATVNTGSLLGKPITEMVRNADGSISFWAMKAPLPSVAIPSIEGHKINSPTSLTVNWLPGDNNDVTYTLEVKEHKDITYQLVMSADFSNEYHGWASTGYTVAEFSEKATRFGSNKQQGTLQSPNFTTDDSQSVTVRFNAKYYGTDNSSAKVSILNASGSEIASETVALSGSFADYAVKFDVPANSSAAVKFSTTALKKRFYLSSADIYTGDATVLADSKARANESGDATSRTITGITTTTYTVDGLTPLATYDYRVKAVPTDAESFSESPWSETGSVTLSQSAGISDIATSTGEAEYFTLQGIRVDASALTPGFYIIRTGTSVSKVFVK